MCVCHICHIYVNREYIYIIYIYHIYSLLTYIYICDLYIYIILEETMQVKNNYAG